LTAASASSLTGSPVSSFGIAIAFHVFDTGREEAEDDGKNPHAVLSSR